MLNIVPFSEAVLEKYIISSFSYISLASVIVRVISLDNIKSTT